MRIIAMRNALLIACLLLPSSSPSLAGEPPPKRSVARGWLGFGFELHREPGKAVPVWLHVRRVTEGGPAFKAGLRSQDVIVEIDDKPLRFATDTAALDFFSSRRAGEKVILTLARATGRTRLTVVAEPPPPRAATTWKRNYDQAGVRDARHARPRK
jgi:S1-C subfamily serine protease